MALNLGFIAAVGVVLGILLVTYLLDRRENAGREPLDCEILFALARRQETSEFEQFRIAAGEWGISYNRVEQDFKRYLLQGQLPHYVRDYIRRARELYPELRETGTQSLTGILLHQRDDHTGQS